MNKIESYIDSVIPKNIPKSKQQKLRAEIEAHIYDRIDFYTEIGYDTDSSITKALADMGEDEETKQSIRNDFEELHHERTWWAVVASAIVFIVNAIPWTLGFMVTNYWFEFNIVLSFLMIFCVATEIMFCYKKGMRKCLKGIGISNIVLLPTILLLSYPSLAGRAIGMVVTYIIDIYTSFAVKDFLSGCSGYIYHSAFVVIVILSIISFVLSDKIKKYGIPQRVKNRSFAIFTVLYLCVAVFTTSFYCKADDYFVEHPERSCDYVSSYTTVAETDKNKYEECLLKCVGSEQFLPSVDDVLNDDDFSYNYYVNYEFFGGCGIMVTENLSEEFDTKMKSIDENYNFLTEPISKKYDNGYLIPKEKFEIFDYSFMVIADENGVSDYPKCFGMIAISEEENEILYFAYYSHDLDYIDNMTEFVESNFPGWENS